MFWKRQTKRLDGAARTALGKLLEQRLSRSLKGHQVKELRITLEQLESLERSGGETHVLVVDSVRVAPTKDDRSIPTTRASELVNA